MKCSDFSTKRTRRRMSFQLHRRVQCQRVKSIRSIQKPSTTKERRVMRRTITVLHNSSVRLIKRHPIFTDSHQHAWSRVSVASSLPLKSSQLRIDYIDISIFDRMLRTLCSVCTLFREKTLT